MTAPPLSILCVTKGEVHAIAFLLELCALAEACGAQLVLAGDGESGLDAATRAHTAYEAGRGSKARLDCTVTPVRSAGYVESVLDTALQACRGEYVLRMDDDERCSEAMVLWLLEEEYRHADHWKFCTANLWEDDQSVITDAPLWPDHHTRLSVRAKAGGRHTPHAGSPYGGGVLAPVIHEHHKFLVKSLARRKALARHYAKMGALLTPFTLPEAAFETLTLAPLGDGTVRAWAAHELRTVRLAREAVPA